MTFAKKTATNKCASGLVGEEYFSSSDDPTGHGGLPDAELLARLLNPAR